MRTLATTILAACLTTACATKTDTVYVEPECEVPPLPSPPEVEADALSDLDEATRKRLRERDDDLIDAVLVRQAMLEELCEGEA